VEDRFKLGRAVKRRRMVSSSGAGSTAAYARGPRWPGCAPTEGTSEFQTVVARAMNSSARFLVGLLDKTAHMESGIVPGGKSWSRMLAVAGFGAGGLGHLVTASHGDLAIERASPRRLRQRSPWWPPLDQYGVLGIEPTARRTGYGYIETTD